MDPLDGSAHMDVNVSGGTIFAIYRRLSPAGERVGRSDFLQPGRAQVAAGYVIYGSSTMLVYSSGSGVNGFTLDPSIGEFCLSHPDIRIPKRGRIYSINEGNYERFPVGVKKYIKYCQERDSRTERPYPARCTGWLGADMHRISPQGGSYVYPETERRRHGTLRLQYDCNPLAFIVELAGGRATDGERPILDLEPGDIHQRTPLYAGSEAMMEKVTDFLHFFGSI